MTTVAIKKSSAVFTAARGVAARFGWQAAPNA